jgi:hypothetical protein
MALMIAFLPRSNEQDGAVVKRKSQSGAVKIAEIYGVPDGI